MTYFTLPLHFAAIATILALAFISPAQADSIGGINIVANLGNVAVENHSGNADVAIASVRGRNLNGKDISTYVQVGDVRVNNAGQLGLYVGSVIDPNGNGPNRVSTNVSAPSLYVSNNGQLDLNIGSVISQ